MSEFLSFYSLLLTLFFFATTPTTATSNEQTVSFSSLDPFLDGSTFHGNWRAEAGVESTPINFHHSYGALVFRVETFMTSLSQWQYVQGLLLMRDGQYADPDVDMRFRLHGVFLPYSQEVFLFTYENWENEHFLSFLTTYLQTTAVTKENENVYTTHEKNNTTTATTETITISSNLKREGEEKEKEEVIIEGKRKEIMNALLSVQSRLLQTHALKKKGGGGEGKKEEKEEKFLSKCDLVMHVFLSQKKGEERKHISSSSSSSSMYAITATSPFVSNFSISYSSQNYSSLPFNQLHLSSAHGNISSPSCGFHLSLEASTQGMQEHFAKGTHYCYLGMVVAALQIYHTVKQMSSASSHSSASQVAVYTIYLQALLDAYIYFFHIVIAVVVEPIRNNFVEFAFFNFIAFSLVEMRFLFLLWKVQYPEIFVSGGGERIHREFGIRYAKFYGSLLMGLLCMQWMFLLRCIILLLSSFWLPQIYSNIKNDIKKPLLPSYIITMSLSRLFLPLYLWGCPVNFFNVAPHPLLCGSIVLYISLQGAILLLQMICGPRFMIPARYLPVRYKYHRAVPLQRIECKNDGGSNQSEPCAICYNEFEPQQSRDTIMVTPCDHVFHTECLLKWMEQKMQCPTCRFEPLPVP